MEIPTAFLPQYAWHNQSLRYWIICPGTRLSISVVFLNKRITVTKKRHSCDVSWDKLEHVWKIIYHNIVSIKVPYHTCNSRLVYFIAVLKLIVADALARYLYLIDGLLGMLFPIRDVTTGWQMTDKVLWIFVSSRWINRIHHPSCQYMEIYPDKLLTPSYWCLHLFSQRYRLYITRSKRWYFVDKNRISTE